MALAVAPTGPLSAPSGIRPRGPSGRVRHRARRTFAATGRLLAAFIPVFIFGSFFTFLLGAASHLNPATLQLGEAASPQAVAALNKQWGLDRPFFVQYFDWFGNVLRGDFGKSWVNGDVGEFAPRRSCGHQLVGGRPRAAHRGCRGLRPGRARRALSGHLDRSRRHRVHVGYFRDAAVHRRRRSDRCLRRRARLASGSRVCVAVERLRALAQSHHPSGARPEFRHGRRCRPPVAGRDW